MREEEGWVKNKEVRMPEEKERTKLKGRGNTLEGVGKRNEERGTRKDEGKRNREGLLTKVVKKQGRWRIDKS